MKTASQILEDKLLVEAFTEWLLEMVKLDKVAEIKNNKE